MELRGPVPLSSNNISIEGNGKHRSSLHEMTQFHDDYRKYLMGLFNERKDRNPRYSLRAFARDIGVASSRLSEILRGKVGLSAQRALQIGERIGLANEELEHFISLVELEHARSDVEKKVASAKVAKRLDRLEELKEDEFNLIADWYHFPMLEYFKLPNAKADIEHVAATFGLTAQVAQEALERLIRLGYLGRSENGEILSQMNKRTTSDISSQAIRIAQTQVLEKAKEALHRRPVEERELSYMIFKYRKSDVPEIKERIRKFRRELMNEFERADEVDAVGCLGSQFFQLDGEGNV